MTANIKEIKNLYRMFKDTDVGEIELHTDNLKVRVSFGEERNPVSAPSAVPAAVSAVPAAASAEGSAVSVASAVSVLPANTIQLNSKWVGFFTRLNPKTGEYYVKLRDQIKKGDVIAHVRVLGVLQDVTAEADGKVKEILIEEGQPIEFGQPLMRFEI